MAAASIPPARNAQGQGVAQKHRATPGSISFGLGVTGPPADPPGRSRATISGGDRTGEQRWRAVDDGWASPASASDTGCRGQNSTWSASVFRTIDNQRCRQLPAGGQRRLDKPQPELTASAGQPGSRTGSATRRPPVQHRQVKNRLNWRQLQTARRTDLPLWPFQDVPIILGVTTTSGDLGTASPCACRFGNTAPAAPARARDGYYRHQRHLRWRFTLGHRARLTGLPAGRRRRIIPCATCDDLPGQLSGIPGSPSRESPQIRFRTDWSYYGDPRP